MVNNISSEFAWEINISNKIWNNFSKQKSYDKVKCESRIILKEI